MNIKPGASFDPEIFKNPPSECGAIYTWVWNSPIRRDEIDRQLEQFHSIGIKALYILPIPISFRPESGRTFLFPEYLSPEYFELVEYALRKCSKMGMMTWIYDEGGWPSGGACYNTVRQNPAAKLKLLEKEEINLMADKRFYPSREGFVALFKGKKRLPDDYIASSNVILTAYYLKQVAKDGSRIDYTSQSATHTFIENTYEAYRDALGDLFSKSVPAYFTDEPGLLHDSVADNEFDLFIKEYGYDLRDYLYVIEDFGAKVETEDEKKARIDHIKLVGKLSKENYFEKIRIWCEENGVYFSGHLDIDNRPYGGTTKGYFSLMSCLRSFHIPGVDAIWEQIRYPYGDRAPVNDETLGMGFFPRLASSAARQEGRNLAITETFSINGDSITPDEMRYIMNYQAVRGINVFNFMTAPYGKSRCDALSGRPSFCPQKPGFTALTHINEYCGRMSYLLRLGHAEGDCALYLPACDFAASADDLDAASASFKRLGTRLEEMNIPFDIIDDEGIRDAIDTPDGLKLGDALYRYVVVPDAKYIPNDVGQKIKKYLKEPKPKYNLKNKNLRILTRKLDTGRLWFIFNEGIEHACEICDITDGKYLYKIDPRRGEIYRASVPKVDLECGDIAVFYACDNLIETVSNETEYSVEAGCPTPVFYKKFLIDYNGLGKEIGDGAPAIDKDFSGEITLSIPYTLPYPPAPNDRFRIVPKDFSVSVWVDFDGTVYDTGMSPMEITVPGSLMKTKGVLTLTVANTAANEIIAKNDVILSHPKAEVGNYHSRILEFEKRRPPLKIGRVTIEKLK